MEGTVKFYNAQRGYGFIAGCNGDIFFHVNDIEDKKPLEMGTKVEYELGKNKKGVTAVQIRRV